MIYQRKFSLDNDIWRLQIVQLFETAKKYALFSEPTALQT